MHHRVRPGAAPLECHGGLRPWVLDAGTAMPRVTADHALANDTGTEDHNVVFIVPRGADRVLLGASVEPGEYETDLTLNNYPPMREILERCNDFLPILVKARLDPVDPIRLGLRPFRSSGVRVEAEPGAPIVDNYSHGGAGITLSRGCSYGSAGLACGLLPECGVA